MLWLLALAIACGASFPYLSRMMNANERPRLLQAVALVDHGTLALDPMLARGIDPGVDVARAPAGAGGGLYPNKPPGATAVAVAAYALQRAACSVTGAVPTLKGLTLLARLLGAWLPTVLLAWWLARRLGDDRVARLAVMLTVCATPLLAYAHVLFGHSLAALALCVGGTLVLDATSTPAPSRRRAAVGGAIAGAAVVVEYGAVVAAVPLFVVLVMAWRRGVRAPVVAAVAGAVVPIALLGSYRALAFGSPWSTGYHHVVDPGFAQIHGRGLLGLGWPRAGDIAEDLFSPWGGLLYWAPLVCFAPAAWSATCTPAQRTFTRLHLGVLASFVVLTLGLEQAGGWRVGPRYLVAALPALAPALVLVLRRYGGRDTVLAALVGASLFGVVVNALAANWFPHLIPSGNPLRELLVPLVRLELHPYSTFDAAHAHVPWAGAWGLVAAVGGSLALWWHVLEPTLRRRVLVAGVAIAGVLFAVAWSIPPGEDAEQNLAAITTIWEPLGPHAPRAVPLGDAP